MKNINLIFLSAIAVVLLAFTTMGKDFHTSTTKVELSSNGSSMTFTSKFITEDLERAVNVKSDQPQAFDRAVESYLRKHFVVKIDGAVKNYNYAAAQASPKATRLYFEIPNVNSVKTIEIKNSMLVNEFPDQQNFITFDINGARDNFVTKKGTESGKVSF